MADRKGVHVFKKQLILSKLYGDKIFGDRSTSSYVRHLGVSLMF